MNNQPEYEDTSGGQYDKQDVAKAQQLLESAGYAKGADGIYAKDGKRLSLEMMTTQANPLRENTIDVITQQLKAGRHRDQEVPQPGHLRGQGEAAEPGGRPVPDRPLRLGECAVRLRQPVDLRDAPG